MPYFDQPTETLPLEKLRALQNERLRTLVPRMYANIPYYRALFDAAGLDPARIRTVDDLPLIPFTHKTALRDNYPFGLFAVPKAQVARLHCSSGTTGKPIVVGYTQHDLGVFAEVVARSLAAAGCAPGMALQNAYGYGLFTGGLGLHYGAEKLGMTVLPISGGGTEKQLMLLQDFGSEAICCTPSYALTLAEERRKRGLDPKSFKLRYAVLGAEPWTEAVRADVEAGLGVQATNIYGLSEIIGPGVAQEAVEERGSGSYIWEDHFYPEVVDRDSGEPVPHGELGVLVFTTLTKDASPVLRYWTNDITSIAYDKSGGRTHIKMQPIVGRADDMLIIRGVNLFHTQVEAELAHVPELSNNYRLVVQRQGSMDAVEVEVEVDAELYTALQRDHPDVLQHERIARAQAALQHRIKTNVGLSMRVHLHAPGAIPRSEGGKLGRILDKRR